MNQVTIIGNLTGDPVLKEGQYGPMCFFSVAVSNYKKPADYFSVRVLSKQAESCAKFLAKGRKAAVTGPVHLSSFGEGERKKYSLVIDAQQVEFLGNGSSRSRNDAEDEPAYEEHSAPSKQEDDGYREVLDDQLPF